MSKSKYVRSGLAAGLMLLTGSAAAGQLIYGVSLMDFGDAPDSYHTSDVNNGAAHGDGSRVYLGTTAPDYELTNIPAAPYGAPANNDELTGTVGSDEEDGVAFDGSFEDQAGTIRHGLDKTYYGGYWGKVTVSVHVGNHATLGQQVYLDGWIDFGHNGTFGDQTGITGDGGAAPGTPWSEWVVSAVLDPATWGSDDKNITFMFMNGVGPTGPFYSRFRVNYGEGVNSPQGIMNTGEVEDASDLYHYGQVPIPSPAWLLFAPAATLAGLRRRRAR